MWRIFAIGGAGGVMPSLVDKVQAWNDGEMTVWLRTAENYWIAIGVACVPLVIYFVVGSVVAVAYENQSLQKALLLGIGAPAFIVASVDNGGKTTAEITVTKMAKLEIVSTAYADSPGGTAEIELYIGNLRRGGDCDDCVVAFLDEDYRPITIFPLASVRSDTIDVPAEAKILEFRGRGANTIQFDITQIHSRGYASQAKIVLQVDIRRSYWNDFNRSFGAKEVQPFNFDVRVSQ